jgi:hypothetical protein
VSHQCLAIGHVLLEHMSIHRHVVCGCHHTATTQLNGSDREGVTCKAENIHSLTCDRKKITDQHFKCIYFSDEFIVGFDSSA